MGQETDIITEGAADILAQLQDKKVVAPPIAEPIKDVREQKLDTAKQDKTDPYKDLKGFNDKLFKKPAEEAPKEEPKQETKVEPKAEEKVEEKVEKPKRERKPASFEGFKKEEPATQAFDVSTLPEEYKELIEIGKKAKSEPKIEFKPDETFLNEYSEWASSNPEKLSEKTVYEMLLKDLGYQEDKFTEAMENFDNLSLSDKKAIKDFKGNLIADHQKRKEEVMSKLPKSELPSQADLQAIEKEREQASAQFTSEVDGTLSKFKGQDFFGINMDEKEIKDFQDFLKTSSVPPALKDGKPDVNSFIENNFIIKNIENIVSTAIEYGIAQGLERKLDEKSHSGGVLGAPASANFSKQPVSPSDKSYHKENLPQIKYVTGAVDKQA
jgi:hypothetical protein